MNAPDFWIALLDQLDEGVYFLDDQRRITYWSRGAERITGWPAEAVLGSRCSDNILVHVDDGGCVLCETRCPAADTLADGVPRSAEVFLHHRAGHRVPVRVRTLPQRDAAGRIIGVAELFTDRTPAAEIAARLRDLEQWALLDPLTHLPNRRYIEAILVSRLAEWSRYGWRFGVLFADLDRFKLINDRYGHDTGDEVLRMTAATLRSNSRADDVAGRWGGEEFLVVCSLRSVQDLVSAAERYRALIGQSFVVRGSERVRVTVSIGATLAQPNDTVASILQRADRLLYAAKQNGRNCVRTDAAAAPDDSAPASRP